MFSEQHSIAWQFHQNTCRWRHNVPSNPENGCKTPPYKEYVDFPSIELPEPDLPPKTFKELVINRYSCRAFANIPILLKELSAVLRYGYGINRVIHLEKNEFFERPVPSAGGLYPLELYLLIRNVESIDEGIYHYCINPSCLEQITKVELPQYFISQLFMNQFYLSNCSCVILMTSIVERNMWKYGDRGYRYILLDAGHITQNMNLIAHSLGLGSLNLGGFFDHEIAQLLKIDIDVEVPLYAMALGKPNTEDRERNRIPQGLIFE